MPIATSYDFDPTCDVILRMALQYAGVLPLGREPSAQQLAHARGMMDSYFKSAAPAKLKHLEPDSLTLSAGVDSYALAGDTIEVEFPFMQNTTNQTSQTQITRMVWNEYQAITDKAQSGTPIRCYAEKLATVTLYFWPVPEQTYTVTYRRQRLIRNAEAGATLDMTQRWIRGVAFQMAHDMALASSLGLERVQYLQKQADRLLEDAEGRENEGGDLQFVLGDC